jgi:VanZ family protein
MAHFGVHMVLAILAYRSLVLYVGVKRALIWTFIGCGVVAICDEAAQLVATGRASEMVDALMNLLGVETGMVIGYLITKDKS